LSELPIITVAVPSLNQGRYLSETLLSIFAQELPVEVFVADGGSSDQSLEVIKEFAPRLAGWRSHPDAGQSAAINECIAKGRAAYVCWLNSDDMLMPGGLAALIKALDANPAWPAVYGRAWHLDDETKKRSPVRVEPFDLRRFARRCIISQPATLIRRSAWERVGGLDEDLHFAMDYDLWWRLCRSIGPPAFVDQFVAISREHADSKSANNVIQHYREIRDILRRHRAPVPLWTRLLPLPVRWRLARLKRWLTQHG
jgi:GT2 family glycosyltransferase